MAPAVNLALTEVKKTQKNWEIISPDDKVFIEVCWGPVDKDAKGGIGNAKGSQVSVRWHATSDKNRGWKVAENDEKAETTSDDELKIEDPATPAGQRVGAVLVVKSHRHIKSRFIPILEVGECVKVIDTGGAGTRLLKVQRLLNGSTTTVHWNTFFPYGPREFCNCSRESCRCIYEDFEKSKLFAEKTEEHF